MRAKLPKGQGIWPAFWLTNDDPDQAKLHEIDAFEMLGNEPNKIYMTYHLSGRQVYQSTYIGPDFSAGYHTFAVDWQPGYIRWYIDGVKRGEYTGTQLSNQLWITANTDVGTVGSWPGAPDATTVFPQNYDIDYIRAYTTKPDPTSTPTADTIAPTVSIVAPTNGATVSGAVNVTANASDNVGVSKVEFYLDGNLKGTKSSSPYTIGLDSSTLTPGNHTILTKAYDTSNLTAQSQVTISASTAVAPPTIQISSPAEGSTLSNGKNPITVKAVDSYQVTKVSYYLDGKLLTNITTTPFTYYWQTRKVSSGSHLLKAILTDILGRNATSEITVQK
jgi:hypothetical protein